MPRPLIAALALLLPLAGFAQPLPASLKHGLVAWYPLDGAAVNALNRARAAQTGVRPVDGHDGARNGALWFDGVRGTVNLGSALAPARFTIAAWVRPDVVDRPQAIVSKIRNLEGHWARNFELRLDPGGRLFVHVPDGNAWQGVSGDRPIQPGRWTHVAAVYDGAQAQLYVDGTRDGAPLRGAYVQSRADVFIGARPEGGGQDGRVPTGPAYAFLGAIDDVRVWDRPLSDQELGVVAGGALAAAPAPPPYASAPPPAPPVNAPPRDVRAAALLAQYPFDGDASDAAGRAHGKLAGARAAEDRAGNPGGALAFAGKQHVDLGVRAEPDQLTIAVWIMPTRADREQVIFSKRDPPQGRRDRYLELKLDSFGRIAFTVPNGSPFNASVTSSRPLQPGRWAHVAATFDGDRGALYLDGELVGEARLEPFDPAPGPVFVGARPDAARRRAKFAPAFDGRIDDLRFYDGALAANEVVALAREQKERPRRGGDDDDAAEVLLVKVDRLLVRYDAACARGDGDALAKAEALVVRELEQAERAVRGDRNIAERIRRASAEFGRLRGETDAMSLDRKRSALFDLSDVLWNDLVQEFDAGPARARPMPARY
jgi:hypothetical protein